MNKALTIVLGLIMVIGAILIGYYTSWGSAAIEFVKGGIIVAVVGIGLLFLLLGISELKN